MWNSSIMQGAREGEARSQAPSMRTLLLICLAEGHLRSSFFAVRGLRDDQVPQAVSKGVSVALVFPLKEDYSWLLVNGQSVHDWELFVFS